MSTKTFRCITCRQLKARALFPKHQTSVCLACGRLDASARRLVGSPRWEHGCSGYQNHGCRCEICSAAWAVKMRRVWLERKAKTLTPTLTSWWTAAKPEGFTSAVERDQLPRMRLARFGQGGSKPISTDELSR